MIRQLPIAALIFFPTLLLLACANIATHPDAPAVEEPAPAEVSTAHKEARQVATTGRATGAVEEHSSLLQSTAEPEAVASESASAIALPPGTELWVGRGGAGRSWKTVGEFATFKFPDGATADMRLVDETVVVTLDGMQVRELSAGGISKWIRLEVKPAEATP